MKYAKSAFLFIAISVAFGCARRIEVGITARSACEQNLLEQASSYRVTVEGDDMPKEQTSYSLAKGKDAKIKNLQLTTGVTVSVELLSIEDGVEKVVGVARSLPMDLTEESTSNEVNLSLLLSPIDAFSQPGDEQKQCIVMGADEAMPRHGHTMTYLPSLRKILIVGGARYDEKGQHQGLLNTVELYDPQTQSFKRLPDMMHARAYHTATLLPDGKVLIVGGFGLIDGKAEVLKPALLMDLSNTNQPHYDDSLILTARAFHTATMVGSGSNATVVIAGGCSIGCRLDGPMRDTVYDGGKTLEVIHVQDRTVEKLTGLLQRPRAMHQATALQNGHIVFTGGVSAQGLEKSVEVFDAMNNKMLPVAFEMPVALARHSQVLLNDGKSIVVAGGNTAVVDGRPKGGLSKDVFALTELGLLPSSAQLLSARAGQVMALVDSDIVVVGGELEDKGVVAEKLRLDNHHISTRTIELAPKEARDFAAFSMLPNRQFILSGGVNAQHQTSADIYAYNW